jgi:uncharacterized protein YdeI (YjbR/CyaY-like superfamily)
MNPKVDDYLARIKNWQKELGSLRAIILDVGLNEEFKWGVPCYTHHSKNILLLGAFKDYFALSFFKGTLLADPHKVLELPGENSQAVRMFRFKNKRQLHDLEPIIKAYIFEAIEIEKAGLKVEFKKNTELDFPEELKNKLKKDSKFKNAFESLTPGRQRGYNLFFSSPKQSKTREDRIEKYVSRILDVKGINDCVCGHSKRPPTCDGSHKNYE